MDLGVLEQRMMQGIGRSSTVIIGGQIKDFLSKYFSLGELLLVFLSVHVLLCVACLWIQRVMGYAVQSHTVDCRATCCDIGKQWWTGCVGFAWVAHGGRESTCV